MIKRKLQDHLEKLITQYPVVTITGPRQSGKTTLCKSLQNFEYISLESLDQRRIAKEDPRGFLTQFQNKPVVIDEIQYCPELMSYIQVAVDQTNQSGQFVLTGSQQFELMANLTQSLAGRTAILQLLPFSITEIAQIQPDISLEEQLYKGFYPRIYDKNLNPTEMLSYYITTYIERDVRALINIHHLTDFEIFLKLCAGRNGQLLNISQLSNDCGVQQNTIRKWLSVLEASYIIQQVQPYYKNMSTRLVKSPKIYFLDTGLLCFLQNIQSPDQLRVHPLKGAIFEAFVYAELLKSATNAAKRPNIYFLRDNKGHEVDFVMEQSQTVDLVEVKMSATFNPDFIKGITYFTNQNLSINQSLLIYNGPDAGQYKLTTISNWRSVFTKT